jgi:hypothetical protein
MRVIEKYPELKEVLILQRPEGTIGAFTRSKFSENNQAKRLRQTDSITGAWVNLAAGLDRVSKGLEEK